MNKSILLVCHSVGDTNAILAVAHQLIQQQSHTVNIFAIGQAAERQLKGLDAQDSLRLTKQANITYLSAIIGDEAMAQVEDGQLSEELKTLIKKQFSADKIDRALIGTPSKTNAQTAWQIAEMFAQKLEGGLIFNDYLFKEPDHSYWKVLLQNQQWLKSYLWCVPLVTTQSMLQETNKDVKSVVVGHPSIDTASQQDSTSNLYL